MAETREKIEVTWFKPRGLFRKCIGKRRGEDGVIRPAIFWLGHDHRPAVMAAGQAGVPIEVGLAMERGNPGPDSP